MTIKVKPTYDFGDKVEVRKDIMSKKYAIVKFLSSRDEENSQGYTYENTIGAKKYDAVIVPTRYGLSLAVVESLTDDAHKTAHGGYYAGTPNHAAIAEIIESKEVVKLTQADKKKNLKKLLEKKVKEMDEVERFSMYAKLDPVFETLLEEYKAL